jgi:hypothetical protein
MTEATEYFITVLTLQAWRDGLRPSATKLIFDGGIKLHQRSMSKPEELDRSIVRLRSSMIRTCSLTSVLVDSQDALANQHL